MRLQSRKSFRPMGTIDAAKRALSPELMQHAGVSGVGIVENDGGRESIKVYLRDDDPQVRAMVPHEVEGYPVVVETIGVIRANG